MWLTMDNGQHSGGKGCCTESGAWVYQVHVVNVNFAPARVCSFGPKYINVLWARTADPHRRRVPTVCGTVGNRGLVTNVGI